MPYNTYTIACGVASLLAGIGLGIYITVKLACIAFNKNWNLQKKKPASKR